MKPRCTCWVCSDTLRSILKKLKGKERKWYEALIDRCIIAEDEANYWQYWQHKNCKREKK